MKPLGIAIIGLGNVSLSHMHALSHYPDRARVLLGVDLNRDSYDMITEHHFIPDFAEDYKQAINREDIDLLIVCTPPCAHEEVVCAALDKGKYVICEKPMAHSWTSAQKILQKSKEFPGKLSIVYQYRDLPEFQKVQWIINNGIIGDVTKAHVKQVCKINLAAVGPWWGKWAVAGGGVVMTRIIHELDRLYCLFGELDWVEATMGTDTYETLDSEDRFNALFKFKNGVEAVCEGATHGEQFEMSFTIEGTNASVDATGNIKSSDGVSAAALNRQVSAGFTPWDDRGIINRDKLWRKVVRRLSRAMGRISPLPEVWKAEIQCLNNNKYVYTAREKLLSCLNGVLPEC